MKRYSWKLEKIYNNKEFSFLVNDLLNTKITKKNIAKYNRIILKYFTFCNMQLMICENNKMYLIYKDKLISFYNKINNIKKDCSDNNYNSNEQYICFYKNKKIKYSDSTFSLIMNNKDRNIRRVVYKEYLNKINSNKDYLLRQLIKYKENDIVNDEYTKLIKMIAKDLKQTKILFNKYINIKAKILKIKNIAFYDIYKSIDDKKYCFKINDIYNSLNLLFSKKQLKEIINNNLIDLYPKKNKKDGYLTINHYDLEPHILINYNNSFKDILMVCHELGHYNVYKERKNTCTYDELTHFDDLEIPSIVNELLYMKNKLDTKNSKIIISNVLDSLLNNFYRYGIYAIFEDNIYNNLNHKDEKEYFSNMYIKLLKFYYPNKYILKKQKYEYLKLKQLYKKNYCLKYPVAVIISYSIVHKIVTEENYINKYKEFIYSNIKFSYENIKEYLDIDIFSDKTHKFFIKNIRGAIKELELLLEEDKNDNRCTYSYRGERLV